jgi:hypothetical protein
MDVCALGMKRAGNRPANPTAARRDNGAQPG